VGVTLPGAETPGTEQMTVDLPVPSRVLAVGAHPDDIEIHCGATLAKWAASGCAVTHLVLTDGSKGSWDPDQSPSQLIAVREEEQREAARRLGGQGVEFLRRPDGELANGEAERRAVCAAIRRLRPAVVLGHDPWRRYRLHPDHRHAGFVLTDAVVAARDPLFLPDLGLPAHRPEAILLFEADSVNHFERVDAFGETKAHALLAHRSQYETTFGIDDPDDERQLRAFGDLVLARLGHHGGPPGDSLAEAFHRMAV
jgi:LmbE family N-acetylglucosaminyl deacetylase